MTLLHEHEWRALFPLYEPRIEQAEAIDRAITAIKAGKRFIVLDEPTGIGKSLIGVTLGLWAEKYMQAPTDKSEVKPGATFITTQKVLQDQYMRDFAPQGMRNLKSASNYDCSFNPNENCKNAWDMMKLNGREEGKRQFNSNWRKACTGAGCGYRAARMAFMEASLAVTSFAYFLHARSGCPTRQLLVIDEAHNIERQLMSFVEVRISQRFVEGKLEMKWPIGTDDISSMDDPKAQEARDILSLWIEDDYMPKLRAEAQRAREIKMKLDDMIAKGKTNKSAKELIRDADRVIESERQVARFVENFRRLPDNWVPQVELQWGEKEVNGKTKKYVKGRTIVYKTIDVSPYADSLLYNKGQVVICMSATILNGEAYCRSVGIPLDQAEVISHTSPFDIEHRMTLLWGQGSMSMKEKGTTLPILVAAIGEVLDEHAGEKGIIHTHTYSNAAYLRDNLGGVHAKRLLFHETDDRDVVLESHTSRDDDDSVLVSPSMAEGVDLKGDLSKFQIIMKVPYPYLGDPLVKRKMDLNKMWYPYETVKLICQMLGRSVRSHEDEAVTYILDSNFAMFYKRNKKMFPEWFREAYKVIRNLR